MVKKQTQREKDLAVLSKHYGEKVAGVDEEGDVYDGNGDTVKYNALPFETIVSLNCCCGALEIGGFNDKFDTSDSALFRLWESEVLSGLLVATTSHKQPNAAAFLRRNGFTATPAHNEGTGNNITLWTKVLRKPKRLKKV